MKAALVATCVALVMAPLLHGQEAELAPIVVTGTFELNPQPSVTDKFTQHLLKQFETRMAFEEMVSRSPWYYSSVWKHLPMRLQSSSSDSAQFFAPRYLSLDNQHAEEALRKFEKQSFFERR